MRAKSLEVPNVIMAAGKQAVFFFPLFWKGRSCLTVDSARPQRKSCETFMTAPPPKGRAKKEVLGQSSTHAGRTGRPQRKECRSWPSNTQANCRNAGKVMAGSNAHTKACKWSERLGVRNDLKLVGWFSGRSFLLSHGGSEFDFPRGHLGAGGDTPQWRSMGRLTAHAPPRRQRDHGALLR